MNYVNYIDGILVEEFAKAYPQVVNDLNQFFWSNKSADDARTRLEHWLNKLNPEDKAFFNGAGNLIIDSLW